MARGFSWSTSGRVDTVTTSVLNYTTGYIKITNATLDTSTKKITITFEEGFRLSGTGTSGARVAAIAPVFNGTVRDSEKTKTGSSGVYNGDLMVHAYGTVTSQEGSSIKDPGWTSTIKYTGKTFTFNARSSLTFGVVAQMYYGWGWENRWNGTANLAYDSRYENLTGGTLNFTLPQYDITYDTRGGSSVSSQTKNFNTALTLRAAPTKTGYTFVEWNTAIDGSGTSYAAGGSYTVEASRKLYAIWRANKLKITFAANGGSIPSDVGATENRKIATDSDGIKKIYVLSSGNLYSFNQYDYENQTYDYGLPDRSGQGLTTPPTGYTSTRVWEKTAGSGSSDFNETDATITALDMASNLTSGDRTILLYAQWKKTLSITYNDNGGSGGPGVRSKDIFYPTTSYTFTINSTNPTRTGYTFLGWSTSSTATTASYTAGNTISRSANLTLYAVWRAHTYTVNYNGNGNTGGATSSSSHTYGVAKALTANGFTRAYTITYNYNGNGSNNTTATATYTFKNWNLNAGGTSTSYTNQQSVSNLTSTNNGTVNLYAQWNSTSVTLPTPTRTGYSFKGWYNASSGGTKIGNGGASYTPTATITLYAQWTINTYDLIYQTNSTDSDSAVSNMPSDVFDINYGTSYTVSSTLPLKFPYQFEDWYCVEDGVYYDPNTSIVINSDKTLYPYWRNPVELTSETINNILYIYNRGGEGYYKFTPSETATYVVYSTTHGTNSKDVKSYLLNSSATQLAYNDDHGKSLNSQIGNWDFLISYNLTAGQTYYYKTQFLSSEYTGNISVNCGPTYNIQYIDELELATMPSNGTKYYGLYCNLTSAIPSRGDNWEFTGWKINDIDYTSGASFADDDAGFYNSTLSEYVIEAKSQWQKYISLNFNTNGGSGSPPSSGVYIYNTTTNYTFTIGTTTPTKTHCKFLGWYLEGGDSNGITNFQPGDSITLNNSATLKAIWLNYGISKVRYNSNFYNAIPYVYINGDWKECMPFVYSNNQWHHPLSENTESYLTYSVTNNNTTNNYGFKLNSNGFYESQNKGVDNSYALCTINLTINNSCKIYLDCINYGESTWDYGLVSNLNSSLSANTSADTSYKKTFSGQQSKYIQTVSYGTLSTGSYTIMVKFIKDSSYSYNNDSLQFRLRYE